MARQFLGEKKLNKYRKETGLLIVDGMVRGNSEHTIIFHLTGGERVRYDPRTGEVEDEALNPTDPHWTGSQFVNK
jgi:hypothetical protein